MCRLLAMTPSPTKRSSRLALFAHAMVASQADGAQVNGSGVSDGTLLLKSGYSHLEIDGVGWLRKLNADLPWVGHVRKASSATSLTSLEAHPYLFDNKDRPFVAAHNGYITQTTIKSNEPNTDSYRAFRMLEEILKGETICPEALQLWVSKFGYDSEGSFLFMQDDRLWVFRGHRDLWRVRIHDFDVINTSPEVLYAVAEFAGLFGMETTIPEPLDEGELLSFKDGVWENHGCLSVKTMPKHEVVQQWNKKKKR